MSENQPPYAEFVRSLFNVSGDPSKDFTHAILGIVTEVHEYLSSTDEVNALEELGDLMFYVQAVRQVIEDHLGFPIMFRLPGDTVYGDTMTLRSEHEGANNVIAEVCNDLLDDCKRWVGYGKAPDGFAQKLLDVTDFVDFVNAVGPFPCDDWVRIEDANRAKLAKRYAGLVFTQAAAINRDLAGERAVLEAA